MISTRPNAAWLCLLACTVISTSTPMQAAEPIRVGVIGLDNYQAVAFTSLFHRAKAGEDLAGLRVVCAVPQHSPDIKESVDSLPRWVAQFKKMNIDLVESIDVLLERVDAVLVMSLDGRKHLEQVTPVLKAGKPVYIGRPLAASLDEAIEIFRRARQHKTPIFSCSQHRFVPGFIGMRHHPAVGKVLGCSVYGGLTTEPHHSDFFWHGVHSAETLFTIMGTGCVSVTRVSTDDFDLVTGVWKDGRIGTWRAIRKGAIKYSGIVFGDKGILRAGNYGYGVPINWIPKKADTSTVPRGEHWIAPQGEYMGYKGVAIEIAKFFKTRKPPVSAAETTEIFAFLEAAHESKRQGGRPVTLQSVIDKAKPPGDISRRQETSTPERDTVDQRSPSIRVIPYPELRSVLKTDPLPMDTTWRRLQQDGIADAAEYVRKHQANDSNRRRLERYRQESLVMEWDGAPHARWVLNVEGRLRSLSGDRKYFPPDGWTRHRWVRQDNRKCTLLFESDTPRASLRVTFRASDDHVDYAATLLVGGDQAPLDHLSTHLCFNHCWAPGFGRDALVRIKGQIRSLGAVPNPKRIWIRVATVADNPLLARLKQEQFVADGIGGNLNDTRLTGPMARTIKLPVNGVEGRFIATQRLTDTPSTVAINSPNAISVGWSFWPCTDIDLAFGTIESGEPKTVTGRIFFLKKSVDKSLDDIAITSNSDTE